MDDPIRITSGPIGFGADGQTWADGMIFPDVDEVPRGPESAYPYPWAVVVEWTVTNGRAVVTDMSLKAMHGQPVTAIAWRAVPVAQVIEQARTATRALHDVLAAFSRSHGLPEGDHAAKAEHLSERPQPRRGRPSLMSDADYRRVADVYNDAVKAGDPKPVKAVAKAFGITDPKDFRPKAWVREARRRGLICQRGDQH